MTPTTMRVLRAFEGTGTLVFEGKKHRLFHGKDGYVFTLVLHPHDVPLDLMRAKLGEAWTVALIPESETRPPSSTGPEHGASIPAVGGSNPPADATPSKTRTPFHMLPRSQQAGMRVNDENFRRWWNLGHDTLTEHVDAAIKAECGIKSKSELNNNAEAGAAWDRIEQHYQCWLRERRPIETEERA